MELHLRHLVFVTFVTLLSSGLIDAQPAQNLYGNNAASAGQMQMLVFQKPTAVFGNLINYETTKIYRQVNPNTTPANSPANPTFNAADPGTELLLTWVDDGTLNGILTWADPTIASRYMWDGDTQYLNPILTIVSLQSSDHGFYWAQFEDTSGGTNRPTAYSLDVLDFYVDGVITLNSPATIDGCPATYTCEFATGFPRPTIVWTITPPGGTAVDVSAIAATNPRYNVSPTNSVQDLVAPDTVANPGDPHTFTTTSTLILTNPVLFNTNNPAAYHANVVTCRATQELTLLNPSSVNVDMRAQTLDVFVEPKIANMRFEAMVGGNLMTFNSGDTISVNDNSPIAITAVVTDVNPGATITFDASNLNPLTAPSEGTENSPTVADTPLVTTRKMFTFTPLEANAGQFLLFSATNDAVTMSGGCKTAPGSLRLNFNVLAGPTAKIIYTDPVSGNAVSIEVNAATSVAPVCTTPGVNVINILAGSNLAITCQSIGVDPATTITIFQGDGGIDLTTGDVTLGTSDASHVTEPTTNNFNTVFPYTLNVPPISIADNNDVITCRARNNLNEEVYTAACLKFLDPPDSIQMYTGSDQTTPATSPAVVDEGSPLEYNCVAQDANPAAGIFWSLITKGNPPPATETSAVGTNMLFDTTSVLSNTLTYIAFDCDMQLSCTTMHPQSGNPNPVSAMVQLKVRVPPTVVRLNIVATSDPVALPATPATDITTSIFIGDGETVLVLAGGTYNLDAITNANEPSSGMIYTRRSDATTIVETYPDSRAQGTTVTCFRASTSHALTFTPTCAGYDGQRICVQADNAHNAAAIDSCVILEVRVPVTTLTMTISAGATAVTPTGSTFTLTAGIEYTVVCRVTGAKPDPSTRLYLDATDDNIQNGALVAGPSPATHTGGSCDRVSTLTYTFTPAHDTHCGRRLYCQSVNEANVLIGPDSHGSVEYTLQLIVPPTSVAVPTISVPNASTTYTNAETVQIDAGQSYTFTCTSAMAEETPDIKWNLIHPTTSASTEIGSRILNDSPDCTLAANTHDLLITANFVMHNNFRLQCLTETNTDSSSTYILLNVDDPPDSIQMYTGSDQTTPATSPAVVDEGSPLEYNCVAQDANPAAEIFWSLITKGNPPPAIETSAVGTNMLFDTTSVLSNTLTYIAFDCDMQLSCTTMHPQSGNRNPVSAMVQLKVRVPPTVVRLNIVATSDPVALPATPTTDITTSIFIGDGETVLVLAGGTYNLDAITNANEPSSGMIYTRRSDATTIVETYPDSRAQGTTVTCFRASTSHALTFTPTCAGYDGQRICVQADNAHNAAAIDSCVILEVRVPVTTVTMTISAGATAVTPTGSTFTLTAGIEYTVMCRVTGAKPDPSTRLYLDATDDNIQNGALVAGPNPATHTGGSCDRVSTLTYTFTPAHNTHCGRRLYCQSVNEANVLIGPESRGSVEYTLQLIDPLDSSPTISVNQNVPNNQDQDNNPTDASASLFRNTAYVFDCNYLANTVNPPPHIIWDLYDENGKLLHTTVDQKSASADCTAGAVTESYDLTAERVTAESLDGGFLLCSAYTNDVPLGVTSPDPYNAAANQFKARINLLVLTPPSAIQFDDFTTDDDGDGLTGDSLTTAFGSNKLPLCEGDSFDFQATAVGSNPALSFFDITLNGNALGSGSGVTIGAIPNPVPVNPLTNLFDTPISVSFAASFVTNDRNGQILKICAPNSQICNEFVIDIVASPQDPPTLTVSDPFAPRDPTQPNPRTLTDGNTLRLHYNKAYTFTCSAQNARPAAELVFSLVEPLTSVVLQPTIQVDTAEGNGFDSVRTVIYTPGNLDATGHKLCCTATNDATMAGCMPTTVNICVDLEIIEEPEDLKMYQRMQSSTTGRRKRQATAGFEEITEQYTDLAADANFDIRCVAERSAPAAVIEWSITLPNNAALSANLAASLTPTGEAASPPSGNALAGELDQGSSIMLMTTPETLGATVKCCAQHVAIPGGTNDGLGGVYDIDPSLDVRCKNTTIRFPVGAQSIQIWIEKGSSSTRQTFTNGALVKANADEPLQLYCTAFGSRPYVYIGWTGMNPSSQAQDNSFLSSDCLFTVVDSPTSNADPLTQTVDTTKCVNLLPKEEHHGREVYCTGTNIADDTGSSVAQYVVLDLCVPCKNSLKIQDFGSSSASTYADGMDVVLLAGNSRTLECSAKGREQPVIDFYIKEENKERKKLTLADGVIATALTPTGNIAGLYEVKIRFEISVSNTKFQFNGATLTCECVNAIDNKESKGSTSVVLKAFDVGPTQTNTLIGTGDSNSFAANLVIAPDGKFFFFLSITGIVSGGTNSDPFSGSNFPAPSNVFNLTRRKRQTNQPGNQLTCISRGTNPAVDFIWKLDGQVISGIIETTSQSSILNVGNEGLVDTFSTFTFDPLYRGYHSRELCCEVSSSLVGSPIRNCVNLAVFSGPNDPMQVDGTRVVNEGQTVQLQCTATDHYPVGVFSWDDDAGNTAPVSNANQIQTPPKLLPNFRYEESSTYSFVTRREDNGKEIICEFDQNYNKDGIEFTHKTTEKIPISVNFCPTSSAELTGCPNAPVAPGRDVTIQCQSAVSNPPLQLQWRMNNVVQNPSTPAVDQLRGYGFVTSQSFTTRQLALVDDGIQVQCCPEHTIPSIGCNQFCSPACTINVAQPTADPGCQWNRVEMTLDSINGNPATWDRDYANHQSSKYQDLTNGLLGVMQHVLDGQPDYRSAILPTLVESTDGLIQAIFGVEFNSPYRSTTSNVQKAIADATNGDGNLVGDGGVVFPYQILPNSATVVCVCEGSYCLQGAACRPSDDDYSSTCTCPADYTGPRCETFLPGQPTRPPSGGVKYARIGFILAEINNQPATWKNEYNDVTNTETRDLINSLDSTLTPVFEAPFTTCFVNVRIADLFESTGGTVGVIAGVELSNGACDQSIDDVRNEFINSVDGDQRIGGSGYKLNSNYLQETNVEEICGNDFSCSNSGTCQPSDNSYYSSCRCNPGYTGDRCQTIIRIPVTQSPGDGNDSGSGGLSQNVLISIIIGVVLFAAIVIGLCLLCCFLFGGDRERVLTRYIYSDEEEPRRDYATPLKNGSYPLHGRGKAYDDWPWSSDGRPPVAYNGRDMFDFDSRGIRGDLGPRPAL